MTDAAIKPEAGTQTIMVDETFPHAPETIWKVLTSGALIARWLMPADGFAAVAGTPFTFKTTPGGAWDGTIHCRVLDVVPNERLVYSWKGGHESNAAYGSLLDTIVTFTLSRTENGTRIRLTHSGFVLPRNDSAFKSMGDGWKKVVPRLGTMIDEQD